MVNCKLEYFTCGIVRHVQSLYGFAAYRKMPPRNAPHPM